MVITFLPWALFFDDPTLFPLLLKQPMEEDGIRPNEKFYSALIRATGNGERSDVTLLLLQEMKNKLRMKPGVRTLNTAVGACGKV